MATNDLRKWAKRERLLRCVVESIIDFVQNYVEARDKGAVDARLNKLDEVYDSFCEVRMNIELLMEDDYEEELTETEESEGARNKRIALQKKNDEKNAKIMKEFVNQYFALKQSLQAFLTPPGSSTSVVAAPPTTLPVATMRVKLPELKLPVFRGSLMEWVTFRDSFQNLIIENHHLSDIDRFTYLRSSLAGEALQQVASIDLTADNFSIAWNSLESRYANKKLLVKSHLDALFAVQPMKKESFESLNHVINEFDKHLQMLDKLGEHTANWSTILVHMLSTKLDSTTHRLWETEHRSTEVPKFDNLMEFLRNHRTVLRSIAGENPNPPEQRKPSRVSSSYAGMQSSCPLCGEGQHMVFQCKRFKSMKVDERRNAVKSNQLCFNCLFRGHAAKVCTRGACRICGQRHHSMLHFKLNESSNNQSVPQSNKRSQQGPQYQQSSQTSTTSQANSQAPNTPQQPNLPSTISRPTIPNSQSQLPRPTDIPTSHNVVLSANESKAPRSVILATAIVVLEDQFGNTMQARALLDSGSQLCFITEHASQRLKFKRSREALSISGIGQAAKKCKQSIFARVRSRITSFAGEEVFYVLPQVTLNLPIRKINSSRLDLPEDIVLADPLFTEPSSVDVIIGAGLFCTRRSSSLGIVDQLYKTLPSAGLFAEIYLTNRTCADHTLPTRVRRTWTSYSHDSGSWSHVNRTAFCR